MRYFLLIGVIIAVVAAWTGAWFFVAGQVRDGIEARVAASNPGREISHGGLSIGGYPYRIKLDIDDPRLTLRGAGAAFDWELDWQTDAISTVRHLWQPRHVLLDLNGQHRVKMIRGDRRHDFTLDSHEALASVEVNAAQRLARLSLDMQDPRLAYASPGVPGRAIAGQRLQFHVRRTPEAADSVDIALRGDTLEFAKGTLPVKYAALAPVMELLDLNMTVTGLPETPDPATPVTAWRDGGGTVEIRKLQLIWGDVTLTASGSLALDGEMRPIGALTAKIRGHERLIDLAVAAGSMSRNGASAARAVLGLLAAAGGGTLSVPLRLQDGQLFLGPVAIAKLLPLAVR